MDIKNYRNHFSSPLMRRILLVNALPLVVLVATLLYLNQFQNSLIETEVGALREQAKTYAGAMGQSAVVKESDVAYVNSNPNRFLIVEKQQKHDQHQQFLSVELVKPLLFSLIAPSPNIRARIYDPSGQLVVDSFVKTDERQDSQKQSSKRISSYPKSVGYNHHIYNANTRYDTVLEKVYNNLLNWMPYTNQQKIQDLDINTDPDDIPKLKRFFSLSGDPIKREAPPYIRRTIDHRLFITVSEPIMHGDQFIGIVQLTRETQNIDRALFSVRSSILILFLLALGITVLLSWYLSLTIARPLVRLAIVTHKMRESIERSGMVPEQLLVRKDEIGDLARALQDSAKALWSRMDATERFAADVSHELKNPLSSIRSAIELLPRIEDIEHQKRLFYVIKDDIHRLDRLITDIASSSRIEAEMSRVTPHSVAVFPIFQLLSEMHEATYKVGNPHLIVKVNENGDDPKVLAVEDRLVQVLRNLIGNASSFSPSEGKIILSAISVGDKVEITVSDEGPGIPESKLNSIFERFYTERPQNENFGQHSGLGLSICRQIIDALKGSIQAHNRHDDNGNILGASFVIILPKFM